MALGHYQVSFETNAEALETLLRVGEALDETRTEDQRYLAAVLEVQDFRLRMAFLDLDNIRRVMDATRLDWILQHALLTPDDGQVQ